MISLGLIAFAATRMNATALPANMTAPSHKTRLQSPVGERRVLEKTVLHGRSGAPGTCREHQRRRRRRPDPSEPAGVLRSPAASRRALRAPLGARGWACPPSSATPTSWGWSGGCWRCCPPAAALTVKLTDNRYTMVMVRRGTRRTTRCACTGCSPAPTPSCCARWPATWCSTTRAPRRSSARSSRRTSTSSAGSRGGRAGWCCARPGGRTTCRPSTTA